MRRQLLHRGATRRGLALLFVLFVLVFIGIFITAVLRSNISQRQYVRMRRDRARAMALARSGAEEAVHRIAAGSSERALVRETGRGRYEASWEVDPTDRQTFRVAVKAISDRDNPSSAGTTLRCRVKTSAVDGADRLDIVDTEWLD